MIDRLADYLLAALLSAPVVYGSAAVLVLLLACGVGWPWALLLIGAGNVVMAVWWVTHLIVTRSPW